MYQYPMHGGAYGAYDMQPSGSRKILRMVVIVIKFVVAYYAYSGIPKIVNKFRNEIVGFGPLKIDGSLLRNLSLLPIPDFVPLKLELPFPIPNAINPFWWWGLFEPVRDLIFFVILMILVSRWYEISAYSPSPVTELGSELFMAAAVPPVVRIPPYIAITGLKSFFMTGITS